MLIIMQKKATRLVPSAKPEALLIPRKSRYSIPHLAFIAFDDFNLWYWNTVYEYWAKFNREQIQRERGSFY